MSNITLKTTILPIKTSFVKKNFGTSWAYFGSLNKNIFSIALKRTIKFMTLSRWRYIKNFNTLATILRKTNIIPRWSSCHSLSKCFYFFWSFIKFTMTRTTKLFPIRNISKIFTRDVSPFKVIGLSKTSVVRTFIGLTKFISNPHMNSRVTNIVTFPMGSILICPKFVVIASGACDRAKLTSTSLNYRWKNWFSRLRAFKTFIYNHITNNKILVAESKGVNKLTQ